MADISDSVTPGDEPIEDPAVLRARADEIVRRRKEAARKDRVPLVRKPTFFASDDECTEFHTRRLAANSRVPFQNVLRAAWLEMLEDRELFARVMTRAVELPAGRY